jgi:hypothetical protein
MVLETPKKGFYVFFSSSLGGWNRDKKSSLIHYLGHLFYIFFSINLGGWHRDKKNSLIHYLGHLFLYFQHHKSQLKMGTLGFIVIFSSGD